VWVRDWRCDTKGGTDGYPNVCRTPDEKTPALDLALQTHPCKEKSKPSEALQINADRFKSFVARLTSNSIDELQRLVSELQKVQEFLKSEVASNRQGVGRN